MSRSKRGQDESRGRRGYHHGNLSEALVQAALDLITEFGPAGFSFAEVTRAVGVSPAAPYRHFRDRDALMADIARRGFDKFAEALSAAWQGGQPEPLAAFKAVGQAY
ncbi:MAG: TetR/AcrR family transcriptional regulator, partial [Alphaproteobacteria bacterium]|nr:TetR/AcrR family transcriptional regulator [Alphaproteobacteria bacterium]